MADQNDNRDRFAPPPTLTQTIALEERRLGIDDDNQALSPDEKDAALLRDYNRIAAPIGQLVKEAKPLDWVVENLIARGGLYALAGSPKKARKSLLALDMCLAVAQGRPFLGLKTNKGKAVFANFEDGRARCARRLKEFGISPDALDNVDVVADRNAFPTLCAYVKWFKPAFVVLDPLMELELLMGVRDENRSDQLGAMLGQLRDLARDANSAIMAPHHLAKATQNMRGSSALEGALDGWIYVRQKEKEGTLSLEWTNRDSEPGTVGFGIDFTGGRTRVAATNAPVYGPLPEQSGRGQGAGAGGKGAAKYTGPSDAQARSALLTALLNSTDGLGRDDRKASAGVGVDRLQKIQSELLQEGLVEQKGRKMVLTEKGKESATKAVAASAPRDVIDLIGGDDAAGGGSDEPTEENGDE